MLELVLTRLTYIKIPFSVSVLFLNRSLQLQLNNLNLNSISILMTYLSLKEEIEFPDLQSLLILIFIEREKIGSLKR